MDSAWSLGILALWTVVLVLAVQLQFLRWTMLMFQRSQRPPEDEQRPRPAIFVIVPQDDDPDRQAVEHLRAGAPEAELPVVVLESPATSPVKQRRRRRRRKRRAVR